MCIFNKQVDMLFVCVCVYVCICIYVYVYVCMYVYIYIKYIKQTHIYNVHT